ncbi:hypothetical protein LTR08_003357 [Meristemomyces frigidus]|nr:hypothetical protein LTR08_003357 [Meristemomyces frigidus]
MDKIAEAETGSHPNLFGKGQLLFLTRQLSYEDADKLLNAGFRFGSIHQVGRTIAEPMQIPLAALEMHVAGLKRYVDRLHTLEKPGTWLAFFGLIPRPNTKGFDVGVKRGDQDQLPDAQLLPAEPQQWQAEFLQRMDSLRPRSCVQFLEDRNQTDVQRSHQEQQFARVILDAIAQLGQQVPAEWVRDARFLARPVFAHYSHHPHRGVVSWIYSFCVIADMHTSLEACSYITRIPLTFFSARQRCYKGSPDHGILAQNIHQEFGPLLARRTTTKQATSRTRKLSVHLPRVGRKSGRPRAPTHAVSRSSSLARDDGSSEHELVDKPPSVFVGEFARDRAADGGRDNIWGGILVNSETVVKSDSKSDCSHESNKHDLGLGMNLGLGMKVAVGTARQEDTFVDELMDATRTRFMPPKIGYS